MTSFSMSGVRSSILITVSWIFLLSAASSATTYYIDYASGNDANNGTSKSTPWQHLPGMQGCSGSCASAKPTAGSSFILKGGVTWPNGVFPIAWSWSGSTGSPIYIGVDQTWYSGSSWTRPIFDAQGAAMGSTNNFVRYSGGGSYVTWDHIEMKGLVGNSGSYGNDTFLCLGACASGTTNVTVTNCYFHDWSHGTETSDNIFILLGDTNSPYMSGSVVDSNVVDNSDGDDISGAFIQAMGGTITHNVVHDLTNGILLSGHGEVGYNLIYRVLRSFDSSTHENAVESNASDGGAFYIHDNVLHDLYGELMFLGGNATGQTFYVWNNVAYNLQNANSYHIEDRNDGWTGYYFNNTIVPASSGNCFIQVGNTAAVTLTLENNHCITTGSLDNFSSPVVVARTTNVVQTPSAASAQGYSGTELYAYSPTTSSGATVGKGTDASGNWPSGFSTNDSSYACTQSSSNEVSCPSRTPVARPATWDVGAYLLSQSASSPNPPTNLSATIQ